MSISLPVHDVDALSLVPITTDDHPFLAQLYASTRLEEMQQSGWPQAQIMAFLTQQFQLQHDYYQAHFPRANFFTLVYRGQKIGRLYYGWEENVLRLIDIALLPDFKRRGIGRYLLNDLLAQARARQCKVELHVEYNNPVLAWYERLGFVACGENGIYHKMRWQA